MLLRQTSALGMTYQQKLLAFLLCLPRSSWFLQRRAVHKILGSWSERPSYCWIQSNLCLALWFQLHTGIAILGQTEIINFKKVLMEIWCLYFGILYHSQTLLGRIVSPQLSKFLLALLVISGNSFKRAGVLWD